MRDPATNLNSVEYLKFSTRGDMYQMKPVKTKDKTVLRSLGLGGYFGGGAEGMVDVKDGKIVRVRPMRYGWKYKKGSPPVEDGPRRQNH